MDENSRYEEFAKNMAEKYPRYCGDDSHFGGFAIGEGWYHIVETLIAQIDHYTKWKRNMRAYDLRLARAKAKGRDALMKWVLKGKAVPSFYDEQRVDDIMENEQRDITPKVEWIRIAQIKEKFGGLRFYYDGGDDHISGFVDMAELWAGHSCEQCGNKGHRRDGGWVRTLCDTHEAEYQERMAKMKSEDDDV